MKEAETAEVHVYQGSNSLEVVLAELERVVICKEEAYSLLVYLILGKLYQNVVRVPLVLHCLI